jgi:integrase
MASLHRNLRKSQYWNCSFFDEGAGKWRQVSTGTKDRAKAMEVCAKYEALARPKAHTGAAVPEEATGELLEAGIKLIQMARRGNLGEDAGREFVNRLLKAVQVEARVDGTSVADFLRGWIEGRKLSKAQATGARYNTTIEMFLEFLGARSTVSLAAMGAKDIEKFRNHRLKEVSPSTVTDDLKILRTAFNTARKQGAILSNPVEGVDFPASEAQSREAFTPAEVPLLVAAAEDSEWKLAIMFGAYAGCRLSDAVQMDWAAVDFEAKLLRYRQRKTKRSVELPIHKVLLKQLEKMAGDSAGLITPGLAKQNVSGKSGLSRQFLQIARAAGVDVDVRAVQREQNSKRRSFTGKSFHSLRSSFVSAMANAGVAPEIRQKLSGHTTAEAHQRYTKLELDPLRKAINSIPER